MHKTHRYNWECWPTSNNQSNLDVFILLKDYKNPWQHCFSGNLRKHFITAEINKSKNIKTSIFLCFLKFCIELIKWRVSEGRKDKRILANRKAYKIPICVVNASKFLISTHWFFLIKCKSCDFVALRIIAH